MNNLEAYLTQYRELPRKVEGASKPDWHMVANEMLKEFNKAWANKKYGQMSREMWYGCLRGHDSWWLSDLFFDCYSKEKGFDTFKAWSIIKTHRVKKEKKPKQKEIKWKS